MKIIFKISTDFDDKNKYRISYSFTEPVLFSQILSYWQLQQTGSLQYKLAS